MTREWIAGSRGAVSLVVLASMVFGVLPVLIGVGQSAPGVDIARSSAWFVNPQGELVQVNGTNGRPIVALDGLDLKHGPQVQIREDGTLVYVLDQNGRLRVIDGATQIDRTTTEVTGDQLLVNDRAVYVVDSENGQVAFHDSESSEPGVFRIYQVPEARLPLGVAGLQPSGVLWVGDAEGVVHRVVRGRAGRSTQVGEGRGVDVEAVGDRVAVVEPDGGQAWEATGARARELRVMGADLLVAREAVPGDRAIVSRGDQRVVALEMDGLHLAESAELDGGTLSPPTVTGEHVVVTAGRFVHVLHLDDLTEALPPKEIDGAQALSLRSRDGIAYAHDPDSGKGLVVNDGELIEFDINKSGSTPTGTVGPPGSTPEPIQPTVPVVGPGSSGRSPVDPSRSGSGGLAGSDSPSGSGGQGGGSGGSGSGSGCQAEDLVELREVTATQSDAGVQVRWIESRFDPIDPCGPDDLEALVLGVSLSFTDGGGGGVATSRPTVSRGRGSATFRATAGTYRAEVSYRIGTGRTVLAVSMDISIGAATDPSGGPGDGEPSETPGDPDPPDPDVLAGSPRNPRVSMDGRRAALSWDPPDGSGRPFTYRISLGGSVQYEGTDIRHTTGELPFDAPHNFYVEAFLDGTAQGAAIAFPTVMIESPAPIATMVDAAPRSGVEGLDWYLVAAAEGSVCTISVHDDLGTQVEAGLDTPCNIYPYDCAECMITVPYLSVGYSLRLTAVDGRAPTGVTTGTFRTHYPLTGIDPDTPAYDSATAVTSIGSVRDTLGTGSPAWVTWDCFHEPTRRLRIRTSPQLWFEDTESGDHPTIRRC